ncbi:MAG TPA: GyrI-like domain-containing protein [Cyclobacteriaceae bacterium]|nr:GyrI-like domain-containing protein [Cyclobacteriaceae bacterium]
MVINEYAPTLKQVKPINFLFFRTETTVSELEKFLPIANDLFKEAFENKLRITGPVHWHYFGFSPEADNSFTLEVALPVADVIGEYDGSFHFKRTEPFKCVSLMHEGSWQDLPRSYGSLMQFIMKKNLKVSGVNREIYINADFANPDANITEVQIGIL